MALTADERCYIEEELAKTKAITSGVVEAIVIVNDEMAQLRDQSYETMAEVRSAADKLILEIRSHEQKLIDKVAEILEWKEACLQKQKKTLEDFLEELQQSIDYTSDALNKPNNQDIDEWKTALTDHLLSLQSMKDYTSKPDIYDGSGFVFLYENEQVLRSVASYGNIVNDVKHTFDRKEGESLSGIPVMPIITLNGLVVDLVEEEKKNYDNSETDDDDDDDDESDSSDEESDTAQSDDYDNKGGKDDKSTKRQKRIRATYDDHDDVDGGSVKNNDGTGGAREEDTDKQKIGESISNSKTNRGIKLSTLL